MKSRRIKTGHLNKKTLHFSNSRRLGNKDLHSIVLACTGTFKVEMTLEQTFGLIKTDTIAENFKKAFYRDVRSVGSNGPYGMATCG